MIAVEGSLNNTASNCSTSGASNASPKEATCRLSNKSLMCRDSPTKNEKHQLTFGKTVEDYFTNIDACLGEPRPSLAIGNNINSEIYNAHSLHIDFLVNRGCTGQGNPELVYYTPEESPTTTPTTPTTPNTPSTPAMPAEMHTDTSGAHKSNSSDISVSSPTLSKENHEAEGGVGVFTPQQVARGAHATPPLGFRNGVIGGEVTQEDVMRRIKVAQKILPNLRDLSKSGKNNNFKPGMIYRSARPFVHNAVELVEVLYELLGITDIIDMRDYDMSSKQIEHGSRLMELGLYSLKVPESVDPKILQHMSNLQKIEHLFLEEKKNELDGCLEALTQSMGEMASKPGLQHHVDSEVDTCEKSLQLIEVLDLERKNRNLHIVDIMDAPPFKKAIMGMIMESPPYLLLLGAMKASDKLWNTSLSSYYYCKFFMAPKNLAYSYIEMLKHCGFRFMDCLQIVLDTPGPLLFHCTLGKDRTGLLSILILYMLGSSISDINFDFALTDKSDKYYIAFKKEMIAGCGLHDDFERADDRVLDSVFDWLKENFGDAKTDSPGILEYLEAHKFDKQKRNIFRTKYLIDPSSCLE